MADVTIRFDVRISPAAFRWSLAGLLLSVFATELASESVTLTTYYPAPSGVYQRMITTEGTWLARDNGSVAIGANVTPAAADKLVVMNGNVGVGTTDPSVPLHVVATGGFGAEPMRAQSDSTFFSGVDAAGSPRYAINIDNGRTELNHYGNDGGWFAYLRVMNGGGANGRSVVFPSGRVGVGVASPIGTLDVDGTVIARPKAGFGCSVIVHDYPTDAGGVSNPCPSNQYITLMEGFMGKTMILTNSENPDYTAICCPCPGGNCPGL